MHRLDTDYLRALRADMQHALDQVDEELTRRSGGHPVDEGQR
jgi:hypothetical protein